MNATYRSHSTDTNSRLVGLLDQFPAGCESDFDTDLEPLEREFAELRLTFCRGAAAARNGHRPLQPRGEQRQEGLSQQLYPWAA